MPRNLLLYVAGGLLVLALLVTFLLLPRSKPAEPAAPPAPVKQVYAVTDIPPHIHITYGMLHEMTTTTPRADVATNINDVVGRVPLRLIRRGAGREAKWRGLS